MMANTTNFDVRETMGELNYLIDKINEYWEKREFYIKGIEDNLKDPNRKMYLIIFGACCVFCMFIPAKYRGIGLMVVLTAGAVWTQFSPAMKKRRRREKELKKCLSETNHNLDYFIKKEWNHRIKKLKDNQINIAHDRVLRDNYNSFIDADKEIQKMTIVRQRLSSFAKIAAVAGIASIVVTGVVLGGLNSKVDNQWTNDHY